MRPRSAGPGESRLGTYRVRRLAPQPDTVAHLWTVGRTRPPLWMTTALTSWRKPVPLGSPGTSQRRASPCRGSRFGEQRGRGGQGCRRDPWGREARRLELSVRREDVLDPQRSPAKPRALARRRHRWAFSRCLPIRSTGWSLWAFGGHVAKTSNVGLSDGKSSGNRPTPRDREITPRRNADADPSNVSHRGPRASLTATVHSSGSFDSSVTQ